MTSRELSPERLESIRRRLVDEGEERLALQRRVVAFTGNPSADALLNDLDGSPHAFVFACLVDRQVPAERAWMVPFVVRERTGTFDFEELTDLGERDWVRVLQDPTPAHRFPDRMGVVLHRATVWIAERYDGYAGNIWTDSPPSARLVRRFLEFHGAGPKIATMASNILVRDFRVTVADRRYIDISADVQVTRVMARLGLVREGAGVEEVVYAARELHPEFPGIFDLSLWELGRTLCRPRSPRCEDCYLRTDCTYRRES